MKISNSKKELASIISENGGWRDGYGFSAQDGDDCAVWFYDNAPVRGSGAWWVTSGSGFDRCGIEGVAKLPNWHQTILSRDEYFHLYPAPDADGWIEWSGGECPVDADEADVIAYRLHKQEQAKPEFCKSVMRTIPEPEAKPTIDQLLQDWRNADDFAKSKQREADDAKDGADARLKALEIAAEDLGFKIEPITTKRDWL